MQTKYQFLCDYALTKPGVCVDYKEEWDAFRLMIGNKMFGMIGENKQGNPIFTFKCPPQDVLIMREQFENIIDGYYMNKLHWNSLLLEAQVWEQSFLFALVDIAYDTLLASLPKKVRESM